MAPLCRKFSKTALSCSVAAVSVLVGSPETMSSTPVKGCDGSNCGGGVSDLSSESGSGS